MPPGGWVRLYRSLADHDIWLGERFSRGQAWCDLILRASHRDHTCIRGTAAIAVKRGQLLTSQLDLAGRWRWDRETVSRFLVLLGSLGMASFQTSKGTGTGYTLITLRNYDAFQGDVWSDATSEPASVATQEPASVPHPCRNIKNDKKGKKTTTPAPAAQDWGTAETLVATYNRLAPPNHPRVSRLTPGRRAKANAYLREFPEPEFWERAFAEIGRSALLQGRRQSEGHQHFVGDFDWMLTKGKDGTENIVKVAEGRYRDRDTNDEDDE